MSVHSSMTEAGNGYVWSTKRNYKVHAVKLQPMFEAGRRRKRWTECSTSATAVTVGRTVLLSWLCAVVVMTTDRQGDSSCSSRHSNDERAADAANTAATSWLAGRDDRKSDTRRCLSDVYIHLGTGAGQAVISDSSYRWSAHARLAVAFTVLYSNTYNYEDCSTRHSQKTNAKPNLLSTSYSWTRRTALVDSRIFSLLSRTL